MHEISEDTLSLYFGLYDGRNADLEVVSKAAIQWVNSIKASAKCIDPSIEMRVQFINAHEGSLSLNTVLDWGESQLEALESVRHPKLTKCAIALALFIATDAGSVHDYWLGDQDKLELSDTDREVLNEILEKISESDEVKKFNQRFFNAVSEDSAVSSVGIIEIPGEEPLFSVPSSQFSERSGLWDHEVQIKERISERSSHVILETADLSDVDRKWRFLDTQTGERFSAKIRDQNFIDLLESGGIKETLRKGIKMEIQTKFKERLENEVWELVPTTIEIMKVTLI